jgi:hypothetical protein
MRGAVLLEPIPIDAFTTIHAVTDICFRALALRPPKLLHPSFPALRSERSLILSLRRLCRDLQLLLLGTL